jgi:flagella basal body P-ring formation protein FlgA
MAVGSADLMPAAVAPVVEAPISASVVTASVVAAPAASSAKTLSEIIIDRVGEELNVGKEDYRVRFDTVNPALNQAAGEGAHWDVRSMTRTPLGTVPFSAELVNGSRVLQRVTVQAIVEERFMALCAVSQVRTGTVMTKDKFRVDEEWLDRSMPTLFTSEGDLIGLEAQREVMAGSMLDQRDFKPVVMAASGDSVTVIFMAGSLKVQMTGRAQQSGKLHDRITIRNDGSGTEYTATLIGKGVAVAGGTLTDAQEKKLLETR